ncbi:MAG: methyltransferase domain-containing protein [Candidatus Delongbacteria bacterium]|nr:methyltransferase domain-containing protein [Candidatus Delongbacteria bacterium]
MTSDPEKSELRGAIRDRFKKIANSAVGLSSDTGGSERARTFQYEEIIIESAPPELFNTFCGVGNPFAPGAIEAGEVVLDVGCGSGLDLFVASRKVGSTGRVFGIDLTPEMVALATENVQRSGLENVEVRLGSSEALPFEDNKFQVAISNGLFNLSPEKRESFMELWRVLKPGGRLQFSDIIHIADPQGETAGGTEAWSS